MHKTSDESSIKRSSAKKNSKNIMFKKSNNIFIKIIISKEIKKILVTQSTVGQVACQNSIAIADGILKAITKKDQMNS